MLTHRNLLMACFAALLALGLAACGTGGNGAAPAAMMDDPVPTPVAVDLTGVTEGFSAEAGTIELAAGESRDNGDIAFTCADGGDACTVTVAVADDDTISATSTGGDVSAANSRAYGLQLALDELERDRQLELDGVQTAAADAWKAADGFATAAETDAKNAADAAMGRALFQTAPSSYAQAALAKEHAGFARTAADEAKAAAEKAAVATTIGAALLAQGEAETARDLAETHRGHVMGFHADAVAAAAKEVFVIEGGHEVGDTTIMTDAGTTTKTVDDKTTVTGLLAMSERPMHTVPMTAGAPAMNRVLANQDGEGAVAYKGPTAGVAVTTFAIGKTVDSADDLARLMIVTHYEGSKTVKVYASDNTVVDDLNWTKAGAVSIGDGEDSQRNTADDDTASLKLGRHLLLCR